MMEESVSHCLLFLNSWMVLRAEKKHNGKQIFEKVMVIAHCFTKDLSKDAKCKQSQ